jgi:3-dehydrosphinganine reductase
VIIVKAFTGKHALITGGSSGIGLALARKLAASGANIAILARRPDALQAACLEIEKYRQSTNQYVAAISANVSDRDQVSSAIEDHIQAYGAPDYLFNSAGVARPGTFDETPVDVFAWMMEVNYFGTVNVTRAVVSAMKARRSGYIVNISSLAGILGLYGYSAYCGSKYAVRGFTDALRLELKPLGIHTSIVFPGDTDTPQLEYEKPFAPEIAKIVNSTSGILSPEVVADVILKGVAKRKYAITPGFEASLFHFAVNSFGYLANPIMDFLVSQAIRDINKRSLQNSQ